MKKKIIRSFLTALCCISILVGQFQSAVQLVQATESLPVDFEPVAPREFGIGDDTYTEQVSSSLTPVDSMDEVLLELDITYPGRGGLSYMYNSQLGKDNTIKFNYSGGGIKIWNWLADAIWVGDTTEVRQGQYVDIYPSIAIGSSTFENVEFRLAISTEYVALDTDASENDVKLGLWFNGHLYDNTFFYLKNCAAVCAPYLAVSNITVKSPVLLEPTLPTDFTYVTPLEYGIVYDTYEGIATTTGETLNTLSPLGTLDEALFETKITLGESTALYYTKRADGTYWQGLRFVLSDSGQLIFQNFLTEGSVYINDTGYPAYGADAFRFNPQIALGESATSFCNVSFDLAITSEFVAYDSGEEANDLKLGVWFNDKLYSGEYLYIKDCKDLCEQSLFCYRSGVGSIVLESPVTQDREETNERYNLYDGPYLISGTGKILVNGVEYANGATLTEPGNYRIVSDNGNFVRNVELYDAGKKSTALTYEENVMPIAGFFGPISGTYADGTSYDFVTEEIYALFEDAGINLINYVQNNWSSSMANRLEMIRNLNYAEEHNIGLYVWDSRMKDATDAASVAKYIAPYSQYHSFKGMFIADEPAGDGYDVDPARPTVIDDHIAASQAVNAYCNLHGYINLLPLTPTVTSETDDNVAAYKTYLEEYITDTNPRMLSYDRYVFTNRGKASYFMNLSIARQNFIDTGIPFWTYVQAGNWIKNEDLRPYGTPFEGEFMWNVNTCLAYGARGIQYYPLIEAYNENYTYKRYGILDVNGEPTVWYDYAKKVNQHIAAVDEILLQAESQKVLAIGTNVQAHTGIKDATSYGSLESVTVGNADEGTLIGAFDYQGKEAFYVVNYDMVNPQTITLDFTGTDKYEYRMIQNAVTSYGEGNVCELVIPAGEAVLIVLEDYVATYKGMSCFGPVDFGLSYKEYVGKSDTVSGETKGTCDEINSMDKVMMKTNITFGASTELRYMKPSNASDAHWSGLTFVMNSDDGTIKFQNWLNGSSVYVDGNEYVPYPQTGKTIYQFEPKDALGENITSFLNVPFDLTLTSEIVAYDDSEVNDLKLGVYFNDKLYHNEYIYIKDCGTACQSSLFLYRKGTGSITLASPVIYGMERQLEVTDSIAMNFAATLDPTLVQDETPYMTFAMNGKVLENVAGTPRFDGSSMYLFQYPDVMLTNMADTITATLQLGEYTRNYEYTVLDYCTQILQTQSLKGYSSKEMRTLKNTIVDLVQYATELQKYKGITQSDWLFTSKMEANIPDFEQSYDEPDEEVSALSNLQEVSAKLVGTNSGDYRWKSVGLVVGNKTEVRVRFLATNTNNLKIKATINGQEQEVTFSETSEKGEYLLDFSDIRAYEYDKEITFVFYEEGVAVGAELHYSVDTYLKGMYATPGLQSLLLAIHNYGAAAKAYLSVK